MQTSSDLPARAPNPARNHAAAARAKALEAPRAFQRARMEQGPTTYTIVPKSNVIVGDQVRRGGGGGEDILRKIKAKKGGR
jgi:transcription factor SPN1